MATRVLLAEGQSGARSALRLLLEQEAEIDVVGEVAQATSVLTQVEASKPDTLLLDWSLPGLRSVDLLPALRALDPHLTVIALSGRPEARRNALASGVDAFVSKGEPPEQLLETLRAIGGRVVDSARVVRTTE